MQNKLMVILHCANIKIAVHCSKLIRQSQFRTLAAELGR